MHASEVRLALLDKGAHALIGLDAAEVRREPVLRVADGDAPDQLLQRVRLRLRVPRAFEELVDNSFMELWAPSKPRGYWISFRRQVQKLAQAQERDATRLTICGS